MLVALASSTPPLPEPNEIVPLPLKGERGTIFDLPITESWATFPVTSQRVSRQ